jgi:hypothetical protein
MLRLGHQLVGLDQGQLGQAAEVGLVAPDALLRVKHRVIVAVGALQLDRQAVRDNLLARLPDVHAGAGAQHHPRQVRADDVVRQVVPGGELRKLPIAAQKGEGGHRREDGTPHGVVVDRAGHHGDEGFSPGELGDRHVVHVQGLAGIPVPDLEAVEHVLLVPVQGDGPEGLRHRLCREIRGLAPRVEDGVKNLFHSCLPGQPQACLTEAGSSGKLDCAADVNNTPC